MMSFFPVRKIKRSGKYLFVGAVLVVVGVSGYLEYVATSTWSHVGDSQQKEQKGQIQCTSLGNRENIVWSSKYVSQPWKPEYKGKANLHVFEDWCGSSIASLRKNLHYPIYPHSRITVSKLAVSPSWKKYGLRIFGYIHPHSSGEFLFTVACKDNCEFWLSKDEKPDNLQLCAHVGMTGEEWTAPGEYGKYLSQISEPVILHQQKKNFFELIHKFSDYSSDHVEVAWRLNDDGTQFELIGSDSLSLYTDESSLKMSDINHIPQTAASHVALPQQTVQHGSEMLREDPSDTSFKLPLLDKSRLKHVLPECSYKPTYTIKGAEIGRYQGLQFVHLSYVYPNDYTRLTHMENRNPCFYMIKPYYLKMYGFSHYMQLEGEDTMFGENGEYREGWQDYGGMEQAGEDFEYYNGYVQHNQRKIFSQSLKRKYRRRRTTGHEMNRVETTLQENLPQNNDSISKSRNQHKLQNPNNVGNKNQSLVQNPKKMAHKNKQKLQKYNKIAGKSQYEIHNQTKMANASQHKVQGPKKIADDNQHKVQDPKKLADENQHKVQDPKKIADENQHKVQDPKKIASKNQQKLQKYIKMADKNPHEIDSQPNIVKENQYKLHKHKDMVEENQKLRGNDEVNHQKEGLKLIVQMNQRKVEDKAVRQGQKSGEKLHETKRLKNDIRNIFLSTSKVENLQPSGNDSINHKHQHGFEEQNLKQSNHTVTFSARMDKSTLNNVRTEPKMQEDRTTEDTDPWVMPKDSEMDEDVMERSMYDSEIRWNQTFQISQTDFQTLKSDWIDLNCNVSGNLLIRQSEATTVVQAFMEKLHLKYPRRFFLQRILNIVKRVDGSRGNRYLLELELREKSGHFVRLVHYIYLLKGRRVHKSGVNTELLLCNPYGFQWNPDATIHIIVPVKNQARWVQKFIRDMEELHQVTKDNNINIIITDYSSTDMDIEQTLKQSHLPKYEYLRLTGNFERAAGLQAGIDLITNKHSIVFLCDLHLHFPLSFFNSVRKHCVEGHMAFAPLVMRLNCGATPQEPDGYWEVNGFGLLGIYKSDLDAIGGMNTRDFTNRWGGEDWELLDRIIEAGLEVERLYLRNFYHYHHSKRGMWNRKMLRRL